MPTKQAPVKKKKTKVATKTKTNTRNVTALKKSGATQNFAAMKAAVARVQDLWFVKEATLSDFSLSKEYQMISAKDQAVITDESLLKSGVDIGLLCIHIANAPERRKLLGLKKDARYEVMVTFSPIHMYGTESAETMKVKYGRFFQVEKGGRDGGFTYKRMFLNLQLRDSLTFDVKLTEIDNDKVDPDPLSQILNDTSIGQALDLSPVNPKQYVQLATNFVNSIQNIFGADKDGDDELWNDALTIEPKPTIPGAYRLSTGIYAIVEQRTDKNIKVENTLYHNNMLIDATTKQEVDVNYLVFGVGKSVPKT